MEKIGRLYLHSKHDVDQKVASLNPTWEKLGERKREDEKGGRERDERNRRRVGGWTAARR